MGRNLSLFFEGSLIGYLLDPSLDNFELYGAWKPVPGDGLSRFLQVLDQAGEASIVIGQAPDELRGLVEVEPDDEIQVKLRVKP